MNHLKDLKRNKGRAAATFHLKEKILGNKKTQQEPIAILDPETGYEVNKTKDIKKVSLNYCVKLLKDREAKEGYREVVREKDILHNERMKEKVVDDLKNYQLRYSIKH